MILSSQNPHRRQRLITRVAWIWTRDHVPTRNLSAISHMSTIKHTKAMLAKSSTTHHTYVAAPTIQPIRSHHITCPNSPINSLLTPVTNTLSLPLSCLCLYLSCSLRPDDTFR